MKAKDKTLRKIRGGITICSLLTVVSVSAAIIANQWAGMIDRQLGTQSSKIVNEAGDSKDLYSYNNTDIKTSDDLVNWHKSLAERESEEGTVLLKNDGDALPLPEGAKLTLLGARSHFPQYGGQIGSSPTATQNVSLEDALKAKGFSLNPDTVKAYDDIGKIQTGTRTVWGHEVPLYGYQPGTLSNSFGVTTGPIGKLKIGEPTVDDLKNINADFEAHLTDYDDAAIVVVGRPSSEAADFYTGTDGMADPTEFEDGANILGLSKNERSILAYATAHFQKVIVLVNSDSAMEIDEIKKNDKVQAMLWVGEPGNYGFLGVADILKGTVAPSGHLPDTYAVSSVSAPAMVNEGYDGYTNYDSITNGDMKYSDYRAVSFVDEQEGIYSGYKYYETRYEDALLNRGSATDTAGSIDGQGWQYDKEVSYPFGYGLSYTTFTETLGKVNSNGENNTITAEVTVKNTGKVKGKDVAQIYVQTPYTEYDKTNRVEKSAIQLAGFEKTKELAPNEEQTLKITIDKKYIASYDYTNAKTYILDAGDYYLAVGNGAHEALQNVLAKKGVSGAQGTAEKAATWKLSSLDKTTFATSKNGTAITNAFDDMSLDYWNGKKNNQLSRSDWKTTWPVRTTLEASDKMIDQLRNVYYTFKTDDDVSDIKWGQSDGVQLSSLKGASYDDERWDYLLNDMTLEEAVNIFVTGNSQIAEAKSIGLTKFNVQDGPIGFCYQPLGKFSSDTAAPYYVAADDKNASYMLNDQVTAPIVAATFSKEIADEEGRLFGTDSLWCNSPILWGPGFNTHRTPYNARNHEYYSEDTMLTNLLGASVIAGGKKYGAILSPKHFAFNDQETNRCGLSVFMNEQKARENELRGFQGAFEDSGALGTMTAFNRVGLTYASAHKGLMTTVLQDEWGFRGYAVTDMINGDKYMRADNSLLAGTTILDSGKSTWFTVDAIKKDATIQKAMKEAMHHNFYAIANSNGLNNVNSSSRIIYLMTWWKATLIALYVTFGTLTLAGAVIYVIFVLKPAKEDVKESEVK